ncbi:MAG: hypothetical protein WBF66_05680 [Dehalococcoidia bacterium]
MNIIDLIFRWRRDRREGRQEVREERRDARESLDQLLTVLKMVIDTAPDDATRARAKEEVFGKFRAMAAVLEREILPGAVLPGRVEPEQILLPEDASTSSMPGRLVSLAKELRRAKQPLPALELLRLAHELGGGDDPDFMLAKAALLGEVARLPEAMAEIDRLAERPGERRTALKWKCLLLLDAGRVDAAMSIADEMLTEEEDLTGLTMLSYVSAHAGEYERARAAAEKGLSKHPGDAILMELRLMAALEAGSDGAYELAQALLEADPDNARAHRVMAVKHLQVREPAAALEHARALVEVAPDCANCRVLLCRALELSGDYEGALRELAAAEELEPNDFMITFERLRALLLLPDSYFSGRHDRTRRVISGLSALVENRRTPDELRATALVLRSVFLLLQGARSMSDLDFREGMAIGLPERIEALTTEMMEGLADILSQAQHPKQV